MWTLYIVSFESLFWSVFGCCVHDQLHIKDPFFQKKTWRVLFVREDALVFSVSRPKKSTIYKYVIYIICMGACTYNIGERRKWWSFDSRFGAWQSFHLHANNSPPSPDRNAQHLIPASKRECCKLKQQNYLWRGYTISWSNALRQWMGGMFVKAFASCLSVLQDCSETILSPSSNAEVYATFTRRILSQVPSSTMP